MATRETWQEQKARVQKMTDEEFEKFARKEWKSHQDNIEHVEDSVPYTEFFDSMVANYGRTYRNLFF